jgi:hypothetical protein
MNKLSDYFHAVATKTLTRVEVDPKASNQHEFNGVNSLKKILGDHPEPTTFGCTFIYQGDDADDALAHEGEITWYDARRNDPKRSAEFRLYFKQTPVMDVAREGDLLVFAKLANGTLAAIVAAADTSPDQKLRYIFDVDTDGIQRSFELKDSLGDNEINFVKSEILEALGIEILDRADDYLEVMLEKFNGTFPSTFAFSKFARTTCASVQSTEDPDFALVEWIAWEHKLFRSLERSFVQVRLDKGFSDVDEFLSFSLSVQNRRKSRMGHAFENHLVAIFEAYNLLFERGCRTENHSKPDFMFPSCNAYHSSSFPSEWLTMLGAKSTCKERWRQVLAEAARIKQKHLMTLEGGISVNQTKEMASNNIQLVVPSAIHESYLETQRSWLMNVEQFIDFVATKESPNLN